jgi:microsomal dipeptidase-like Zn-dependent dipeptidase
MKIYLMLFFLFVTTQFSFAHEKGYADLHVHMFANQGFAGAWFLGDPTVEDYDKLFARCQAGDKFPWVRSFIQKIDPYLSSFIFRNYCIPQEATFPMWNDLAHQQVWQKDLKEAHQNGLKLMVLTAVHSYTLCRLLPESRKDFHTCEDAPNLLRQLATAKKFIDEQDWIEVATDANSALKIIEANKLAVILSIEASNVFDQEHWLDEFEQYWQLGVRSMQLVHQFDNTLAGAAIHKPQLRYTHYLRNWLRFDKFAGFESEVVEYPTKHGIRKVVKNKKGLTAKGALVIQEMMKRGMLIDFAHMSEKTMLDVYNILKIHSYPFYISHGHFRDVMQAPGMGEFEKSSSLEILSLLKSVDGVFGLRTFAEATHTMFENFPNDCQGSSTSFAQAYKFGEELGINMAFGSDMNGFITQTKPRFSKQDTTYCPGQKTPKLNRDFDITGLGKISQLKDLLQDLNHMGVETRNIENSAKKMINLWQRSQETQKSSVLQ